MSVGCIMFIFIFMGNIFFLCLKIVYKLPRNRSHLFCLLLRYEIVCTAVMLDCNIKECTLATVWFSYINLQQGGFHKIWDSHTSVVSRIFKVISGWCRFVPAVSDERAQHSNLWAKLLLDYELSIISTEYVALGFCAVGK